MHRAPNRWWTGLVLAVTLAALPAVAGAESKKIWSYKPAKGFVDDPMAFNADDTRFAYVHTDSATFIKLVVIKTDDFKVEKEIDLKDHSIVPQRLYFTPDGKRLLLIWMDGYKGTYGADLLDLARGRALKKLGPVQHAEVVEYKGDQVMTITAIKTDKREIKRYQMLGVRTRDLKKVIETKAVVLPDGTSTRPPVRVMYWEPGHLSLMGMTKGRYDKKRDIRLPERACRVDILAKKIVWSKQPQKLVNWTRAANYRLLHLGQYRYVHVSEDYKTLYAATRNNELGTVTTPVKWGLYEARSLKQKESWDGKTLWFSMTIDPVNPEAVKRKKADEERMDLYRLDPENKPVLLGQVLTGRKRGSTRGVRFTWEVGQDHFSYLKKFKGFGRGGKEVWIYKKDK
jgi:hypothetical protein